MNRKNHQIVVRITQGLDSKIKKAAKTQGLTKAGWVRQLLLETLANSK